MARWRKFEGCAKQRYARLVTKSKLQARTIARSATLLLVKESERGGLPSADELPVPSCAGQISPGDESERSLPRHLLPESRSRFHPPLATRVFFPREGRERYLRATGMSVSRVFLHCHRNESRIHGPATCDITGPSGPGALLFLRYDALLCRHDSRLTLSFPFRREERQNTKTRPRRLRVSRVWQEETNRSL